MNQTVVDVFTVMHLRLKTLFGFCHHVETFDSEIWERRDIRDRRQLRKCWERC